MVRDVPIEDVTVRAVERLGLQAEPWVWSFAVERRADIDAHFATLAREKPVWNGRVLLLHRCQIVDSELRGAFFETDFASYVAWRDWGWPDPAVTNFFGMAALRSADDAFILGVMGDHTANAGMIQFASGTPDPDDVRGNTVDLEASVLRELQEETGLGRGDIRMAGGWVVVRGGGRLALMKEMRSPLAAEALRARIAGNLAAQETPEFSDIVIARGPRDVRSGMFNFIAAYLRHSWRRREA